MKEWILIFEMSVSKYSHIFFCGENLDFFSYESGCRIICRESGWGTVVMGSKYEYIMQLCLWKCHNETHYFICVLKYFLQFFKCQFCVVKFKNFCLTSLWRIHWSEIIYFFLFFWDRILLCNLGCPRTRSVVQACLKLREPTSYHSWHHHQTMNVWV